MTVAELIICIMAYLVGWVVASICYARKNNYKSSCDWAIKESALMGMLWPIYVVALIGASPFYLVAWITKMSREKFEREHRF